jgi:hypothetical protein
LQSTTLNYTLPEKFDSDGDAVNITTHLGLASSFVTFYDNDMFIMNPTSNDIGSYLVYVTITDKNPY